MFTHVRLSLPSVKLMKFTNILFFIFCILMVPGLFIFVFYYTGAFHTVYIRETKKQAINIIGYIYMGNYQKTGEAIIKAKNVLHKYGQPCVPVAVFYSDESKVITKLRKSIGGCVITNQVALSKTLDIASEQLVWTQIDATDAVEATISSAHPAIAKIKVFQKFKEYFLDNYTLRSPYPVVTFFGPKQHTFYVPLK